jgi:hypothetical protein
MHTDYKIIIEQSTNRKKEIKRFFDRLRRLKPTDLDRVTNQLHEEAFKEIDCLQCANCCSTTGPLLKDKDIERLAHHQKMKPGVFTETYLHLDEDLDYVFKEMPCPFLGEDKYCTVYENRPNACRNYPHTQQRDIYQKLTITYHNTFICPAVSRVVEGLMKIYS